MSRVGAGGGMGGRELDEKGKQKEGKSATMWRGRGSEKDSEGDPI